MQRIKNIVGYDIINEPNLGEQIGYGHEVLLGGLYSAVIEGIRAEEAATAGGFNHIVFLNLLLNGLHLHGLLG
ncbi:MAG: hypothetical protein R2728_09125 [Chitinophagales bacterium]